MGLGSLTKLLISVRLEVTCKSEWLRSLNELTGFLGAQEKITIDKVLRKQKRRTYLWQS